MVKNVSFGLNLLIFKQNNETQAGSSFLVQLWSHLLGPLG